MAVKKAERNFRKLSNVEHVRLRMGMWLGQNSESNFTQHFFKPIKNGARYEIDNQVGCSCPDGAMSAQL